MDQKKGREGRVVTAPLPPTPKPLLLSISFVKKVIEYNWIVSAMQSDRNSLGVGVVLDSVNVILRNEENIFEQINGKQIFRIFNLNFLQF